MKESARMMAIAALLAIPGALALTAFLVIALGQALNSSWVSSLMVGAILVATSAIYARRAMDRMKDGTERVQRTAESLGADARWGKEELRTFKRELTA
jgi:membrane protein implicated in regulation of membrane protease activity